MQYNVAQTPPIRTCVFRVIAITAFIAVSLTSQAQLAFDVQELQLKTKSDDSQAIGEFAFTNPTTHTIRIASVKPSCDCTTAKLAKQEYQPGESGKIMATFTIGQR